VTRQTSFGPANTDGADNGGQHKGQPGLQRLQPSTC
jgi:hypothetical protein